MNKKIFFSLLVILLIIVPVFATSILEDFNREFQNINNKFYDKSILEKDPPQSSNLITGENILNSCTDANTLFKVSSSSNAHAALWDYAGYSFRACTGSLTVTDRTCNLDNSDLIIKLSSSFNAHVEKPTGTGNYAVKVCSDDLICNYRLTSCNADETCVASISSDTNAHVGDCIGGYNTKLCCKTAACSISSCEQAICSADQNSCETGQCVWDSTNSKCCQPGKIWDSTLNTCIYDPDGTTVILSVGESSNFAFNNELHSLTFDSFLDEETTTITVASLPATTNLKAGNTYDVNLNQTLGDTVNDFRVRLNSILDTNPTTGSASFTYLISNSGLCNSASCTNSLCNKGFGYCTLGTTCNWYPPNTKVPTAGCCPDGKRWDSIDNLCKNFADPSATCTNINAFQSVPVPYEDVCCAASVAYGFWYPAQVY